MPGMGEDMFVAREDLGELFLDDFDFSEESDTTLQVAEPDEGGWFSLGSSEASGVGTGFLIPKEDEVVEEDDALAKEAHKGFLIPEEDETLVKDDTVAMNVVPGGDDKAYPEEEEQTDAHVPTE